MYELALCAGYGGLSIGLRFTVPNLRTVCYVERESYAASIIVARMEGEALDKAPLWDDLQTFDGKPWRDKVHIVTAGYPCQPFSHAGRRKGTEDPRHLWPHIARIIDDVQPPLVFLENVRGHLSLGYSEVRRDLRERGYEVQECIFSAAEAGASHRRERLFILAHAKDRMPISKRTVANPSGFSKPGDKGQSTQRQSSEAGSDSVAHARCVSEDRIQYKTGPGRSPTDLSPTCETVAHSSRKGWEGDMQSGQLIAQLFQAMVDPSSQGLQGGQALPSLGEETFPEYWTPSPFPPGPDDLRAWTEMPASLEPAICRMDDGAAYRVDRLRALGNGVVPVQAALAFIYLWNQLNK